MGGAQRHKGLRCLLDVAREAIDIPFRALPMARHNIEDKAKKRLLIVRCDGIGDFVLFLDTFKEYRKLYPQDEWEITLLGNQIWRFLAEPLPYADNYWFLDAKRFTRNPIYRYCWLCRVRRAEFDVVIQPNYARRYWLGDTIVRATGARERIGSRGDVVNMNCRQKRRSDGWYTHLVHAEPGTMMELQRNAEFIGGLGLTDFEAGLPKVVIPDSAQQEADAMLERLGLWKSSSSQFRSFYILVPGAGTTWRRWPVDRFADLARSIHGQNGWIGVVCGGHGEETLSRQLLTLAGNSPLLDLLGKTNLVELAGVVRRSKVLIGNETGAVHIASAVGTPSMCIMGGGHFGRFIPYDLQVSAPGPRAVIRQMDCFGCNWRCIYSVSTDRPVSCIEQIDVREVMENMRIALFQGHRCS